MPDHGVLPECRTVFEKIFEKLDDVHRTMLGNGDPRESIAGRLQAVEDAAKAATQAEKRNWSRITTVLALVVATVAMIVTALK